MPFPACSSSLLSAPPLFSLSSLSRPSTNIPLKVYCKPEHADSLASLYSTMTKIAKTEPGIIYYSLARSSADPSIFFFFEHYASKAAFVAHTQREESQVIFREGWFRDCVASFQRAIV